LGTLQDQVYHYRTLFKLLLECGLKPIPMLHFIDSKNSYTFLTTFKRLVTVSKSLSTPKQ